MVASRKEPKRKNSSIFPVALWENEEKANKHKVEHFISLKCINLIVESLEEQQQGQSFCYSHT